MSDYYTRNFDSLSAPPRRDNLFLWTVLILLLTAFAMACWLGSFYIFGHPEDARSYHILQKLHKLDPPKRFEITAAPLGEFLTAQKLYERYNTYAPLRLKAENDELLRMYITNYTGTKRLVPYMIGRFTIISARPLVAQDLFTSGVAAVAQSDDYPQVLLEHVYPSNAQTVPELQGMLKTGLDVKLAKTLDLAAIIHVQRLANGSLQFTAVPLLYGSYALKQGEGTFSLAPPLLLNVAAGLPIVRGPVLDQSLAAYVDYQKQNTPVSSVLDQPMATPAASAAPSSELVRLNSNLAPDIAVPMKQPKGKGKGSPALSPALIASASPPPANVPQERRPPELATASNQPRAYPIQTPVLPDHVEKAVAVTPGQEMAQANVPVGQQPQQIAPPATTTGPNGVPLTPFLAASNAPVLTNNDATWRTYAPGQMPRGRVIAPTDATPLAESGMGGERLYLRGNFVVTASEENRAVLRPQNNFGSQEPAGSTRVIVQYPSGMEPPAEGSAFARDETRPFLITDVRRGSDGQINLYVREVTTAQ
jgi:hypothetical protein